MIFNQTNLNRGNVYNAEGRPTTMTKAQRSEALAKFSELEMPLLLKLADLNKRRQEFLDYWTDERLTKEEPTPPKPPEVPPEEPPPMPD